MWIVLSGHHGVYGQDVAKNVVLVNGYDIGIV